MSEILYKICTKCNIRKPLTEEFFYRARPTATHKKEGSWQSHCKDCWKEINKANKFRIREHVSDQTSANK